MSLEKEIRQRRPFQNHQERALVNIMFTHNWLIGKLNEHFKGFGITRKQYNILRILNGSETPMSTSDIRERMIDKMSDITRLIDRLEQKGYTQKTTRKSDKRLVDIVITDNGEQLLRSISQDSKPIYSYLNGLTSDEAQKLNNLMDKLRDNTKP